MNITTENSFKVKFSYPPKNIEYVYYFTAIDFASTVGGYMSVIKAFIMIATGFFIF